MIDEREPLHIRLEKLADLDFAESANKKYAWGRLRAWLLCDKFQAELRKVDQHPVARRRAWSDILRKMAKMASNDGKPGAAESVAAPAHNLEVRRKLREVARNRTASVAQEIEWVSKWMSVLDYADIDVDSVPCLSACALLDFAIGHELEYRRLYDSKRITAAAWSDAGGTDGQADDSDTEDPTKL